MERIINKIIEIEKSAHQIIDEAQNEKENLPIYINEQLAMYLKTYMEQANKRLEKIKKNEEDASTESKQKLENEHSEIIKKLEIIKKNHINDWIEQIYKNIITAKE